MRNGDTNSTGPDLDNRFDLEALRAEHLAVFGPDACPQWVKDSLHRYVHKGIPTGDMLRAVLANDMQGAFGRADVDTAKVMAAIVGYVYNDVPSIATGSYEAVDGFITWHREQLAKVRAAADACDSAHAGPECTDAGCYLRPF